jgi:prevent-host-death family protein
MNELSVGVRELKAHLSEYLREIKKGKTIVITEHGKPVGRLMPAGLSLDERIEALRKAGIISWNGEKLPAVTSPAVKRPGTPNVSDLLIEDRE